MTLEDNTEVVHSEAFDAEGKEIVKVYIEKPIEGGFQSAECYLPDCTWKNIDGFNDEDIARFQELLESTAHIITSALSFGSIFLSSELLFSLSLILFLLFFIMILSFECYLYLVLK